MPGTELGAGSLVVDKTRATAVWVEPAGQTVIKQANLPKQQHVI